VDAPLEVGVNGAIVPTRDAAGRPGLRFQAPDGTFGPFHLRIGRGKGFLAAYMAARNDWRAWVNANHDPKRVMS
jgi:hypothetical protein